MGSLSAPSRRWQPYKLPQWSLHPRAAKQRPGELALWDTLVEPAHAPASTTVADVVTSATQSHPHSDAFAAVGVEEEYVWDYPLLRYLTRGLAAGLTGMGHKFGSKYMTWMNAGPEAVLLALAGSHVGAVHVAADAACSIEDVAQIIQAERVRTLYFQQRLGDRDVFEDVCGLAPDVEDDTELNWLDSKKYRSLKQLVNATGEAYNDSTMTLNSCAPYDMSPNPVDAIRPWLHADNEVLVPYTAGAGSLQRQDAVTGAGALATAAAVASALQLQEGGRAMLLAPATSKVGLGVVLAALQAHAKLSTVGRNFNAAEVGGAMEKQRPTALVCTEEQLAALQAAGVSCASLTGGLVLGGSGPAALGDVALARVDVAATAAADAALKLQ